MPIIRGGKSAVALRYVDAAGVEHQVVQVRLGDKIVWDGTTPAFVTMPRAVGSGFARPALVSAGQSQEMPLSDHSAGEARPALVSAGANLVMPCATGVVGEAFAPSLFAGVAAEMPTAAGSGEVYPATAGESSPGDVYVLTAVGSGEVYPAVVSVPFERVMPHASGVGEVRAATAYGEAVPSLAVAMGTGVANPATVQHGQSQQMPRALGSGSVSPAVASAAVSAAMPRAVGTGQVYPAVIRTFAPQGAYLSADQTIGGYSSAFFSPLTPLPAYPGSVASGSILTVVGGGAATVVGKFAAIGAWQAINLYRNGIKIVSGAATTSPISWSGTLTDGDQLQLEVVYNNGGSLPVTAGTTNVTLTVTPT